MYTRTVILAPGRSVSIPAAKRILLLAQAGVTLYIQGDAGKLFDDPGNSAEWVSNGFPLELRDVTQEFDVWTSPGSDETISVSIVANGRAS